MRAFYSLPVTAVPAIGLPEAVELRRNATTLYALSCCDPNPALEQLGARRLGAKLADLTATQRDRVTGTRIRRTDLLTAETDELLVARADVLPTDEVVENEALLVIIAGDEPEDYR